MSEKANTIQHKNIERAVTIGVFDGVHRGHQALLGETVRVADEHGLVPTALTFDPHPTALFAPARTPLQLGTLPTRLALLREYGAQGVVVAPFDRALAALTPDEFIRVWLVDRLHAHAVIVGDDFRFGCDRSGNAEFLRRSGKRNGFETVILPPVYVNGVPSRSTTIRQMLVGGQVEPAQALLGRAYTLSGTVVHGRKLGRTIGFPTANLESAHGVLIPGAGVYAGEAVLANGETHRTAISIGTNPTVTPGIDAPRTVEAFLLDFDGDLYDQNITLSFRHFLRGTEKFDSLETLIEQMHRDIARVRVM